MKAPIPFRSTDPDVARRPDGKNENNVWQDVHAYFAELFKERPTMPVIELTGEQLVCDMEARFKGRYNTEMIAKLLKNGFEVKPGLYLFKREDFEPRKRREEVVV